jgi:hypothetical protein
VRAASQRAHTGGEFIGVERFGYVVIRALVERRDARGHFIARRHDQHRGVRIGQFAVGRVAQALQHLCTVTVGQAQIEQHQVERLGTQRSPGRRHTAHDVHCTTLLAQMAAQPVGNAFIVFDHQHSHAWHCAMAAAPGLMCR